MEYKVVVTMAQAEFDRVNGLLDIEYLDDMTDEEYTILCPKTDDYIGLFYVEFENGNHITIDVASGGSNYYDNCVLYDADGNELKVYDCGYHIGRTMVFMYHDDRYIVEIEFEK